MTIEQEALSVVKFMYRHTQNDEYWTLFEYVSNGDIVEIKFMGISIWDSLNDDRDFDENNKGEKIELFTHIIKKSKEVLKIIKKSMKKLNKALE